LTRRQPRLRLAGHLFGQPLHQARFADARFTAEQHHLPKAVFDLHPALAQQPDFRLPTDERRQAGAASGLQATAGCALVEHLIDRDGLSEAFQPLGPERLASKEAAEQL
jgi:hypothetical protein